MITRSYNFNYVTYQYDVMDVETKEDGKKFIVGYFTMDLYCEKTNIPKVPKRK